MRWNTQTMLRSYAEKSEVISFTSRFTKSLTFKSSFLTVPSLISLRDRVRDPEVILDKNLRLTYHINETCRKETNAIRSIARIHKYLINGNFQLLFNALVISRLSYCKSILYSLPKQELDRLQRAQNTAARLITETKQYELINPTLRELLWLPVESRLIFKVILITFKILYGLFFVLFVVPVRKMQSTPKSWSILQITFYCPHSYGERTFSFCASALWNTLPDCL